MADNAITWKVGLDRSSITSGLRSLESEVQSSAGKVSSSFKSIGAGFQNLLSSLGIGLGVAGIVEASKALIDYGAKVQDLSLRFGVSTDSIQKFGNAAEKNGSSLEALTLGFQRMEVARSKAQAGSEEMLLAFQHLGISVSDLGSLKPDELFTKIGASSLQAADVVKVFGRNALELRTILAGIADGSIKLGPAIDANLIKPMKEADTTIKETSESAKRLGTEILANIITSVKQGGKELKVELDDIEKRLKDFHSRFNAPGPIKPSSVPGTISPENAPFTPYTLFGKPPDEPGKPPRDFSKEEDDEAAKTAKEKLDAAQQETEILRQQVGHHAAVATAMETVLKYQKEINEAYAKGEFAIAHEKEEQEKLALAKQQEAIEDQKKERTGLSLKELANAAPIGRGGELSEATIQARRALEEQAAGERARLAQRPEEAERHFEKAGDIEAGIRGLKPSEKNSAAAFREALNSASVLRELIGAVRNIGEI